MMRRLRHLLVLTTVAAGLFPAAAAKAQFAGAFYGPPSPQSLYPDARPADPPKAAPTGTLRRRQASKRRVVHTRRIVREKPIVIETRRIVDDPPRVIERRHSIGGTSASARGRRLATIDNPAPRANPERGRNRNRVIHADAEVTILGPDRMIIRLFRKNSRGIESSARAD